MSILARFRTHMGWTQSDLGARLGVSKQAISQWESGKRRVQPDVAHAFLAVAAAEGFAASLEDVYPAPESLSA